MGADVTIAVRKSDSTGDIDCSVREAMARLPRGGILELKGEDTLLLRDLRDRCRRLGYQTPADRHSDGEGSLTVRKGGNREPASPPPVGYQSAAGRPESVGYSWSVRGHSADGRSIRVHAGRHTFSAGPAVSFRADEPLPSAVEHMLAALAADLVSSFASCLRERHVEFDALECRLSGQLDDPLASIGVVGAKGSPAISAVAGVLYVSAYASAPLLDEAWCAAMTRSPLFNTLAPSLALRIEMRPEP